MTNFVVNSESKVMYNTTTTTCNFGTSFISLELFTVDLFTLLDNKNIFLKLVNSLTYLIVESCCFLCLQHIIIMNNENDAECYQNHCTKKQTARKNDI